MTTINYFDTLPTSTEYEFIKQGVGSVWKIRKLDHTCKSGVKYKLVGWSI